MCRFGSVVFDPFVGSGSVLVSCGAFGALCMGSDYDPRVLRGTEKLNISTNFKQYEMTEKFVGVFRADFSQNHIQREEIFDAIITDPPYGVREGVKKIGRKEGKKVKELPKELGEEYHHVPMRKAYPYDELMDDICRFAAKTLVINGRLVLWHAASKDVPIEDFNPDKELGHHPCLEILNIGLQICGTVNRRMVVYKKVKKFV